MEHATHVISRRVLLKITHDTNLQLLNRYLQGIVYFYKHFDILFCVYLLIHTYLIDNFSSGLCTPRLRCTPSTRLAEANTSTGLYFASGLALDAHKYFMRLFRARLKSRIRKFGAAVVVILTHEKAKT